MLDYKFHRLSSRFTAGWKTEEEKKRENGGRKYESTPKMAHNRMRKRHKKGTPGKKRRKTDRKVEKRATKRKKTCLMQSWERAVFSPRFLVALYKTGGSVWLGNGRMVETLGQH